MSIEMEQKDYVAREGRVVSLSGGSALLGDVLFRLSARRGGFVLMPEFGSRMYLLSRERPSARAALARQYAAEALTELTDLEVTDARVTETGAGLLVQVELSRAGELLTVELEV